MGNGVGGKSKLSKLEQESLEEQQESQENQEQDTSEKQKPVVSCSTTKGRVSREKKPHLNLDIGQANSQNVYLNENEHKLDPPVKGKSKLFRVPNPDLIDIGDKKLLKCAGRTIAVFRISEDKWAALDNACYHHGGPLFMGDIEEYNSELCVVCPWHCTKISIETGKSLYERVDVSTNDHYPQDKEGIKQRVHQVIIRGEDILVKLNSAEEMTYASDRYAADIASNCEQLMNPDSVDAEASSKERREELITRRKSSMQRDRKMRQLEKERKAKNPIRIPPGQLTPRGDASQGPYRPSWVREGELPPPIEEDDDGYADQEYLAFDLAEEFKDLEREYDKRKVCYSS